ADAHGQARERHRLHLRRAPAVAVRTGARPGPGPDHLHLRRLRQPADAPRRPEPGHHHRGRRGPSDDLAARGRPRRHHPPAHPTQHTPFGPSELVPAPANQGGESLQTRTVYDGRGLAVRVDGAYGTWLQQSPTFDYDAAGNRTAMTTGQAIPPPPPPPGTPPP